jgi:hypothetical protein
MSQLLPLGPYTLELAIKLWNKAAKPYAANVLLVMINRSLNDQQIFIISR